MRGLWIGVLALIALSSCESVSVADQAVLSRTAMIFDGRGARAAEGSLVSQVEKGRTLSNSTAGGGCASCQ